MDTKQIPKGRVEITVSINGNMWRKCNYRILKRRQESIVILDDVIAILFSGGAGIEYDTTSHAKRAKKQIKEACRKWNVALGNLEEDEEY